jgi:hypothetical protein
VAAVVPVGGVWSNGIPALPLVGKTCAEGMTDARVGTPTRASVGTGNAGVGGMTYTGSVAEGKTPG